MVSKARADTNVDAKVDAKVDATNVDVAGSSSQKNTADTNRNT